MDASTVTGSKINSLDDLPGPGVHKVCLTIEPKDTMLPVLQALEDLGWSWVTNDKPTKRNDASWMKCTGMLLGYNGSPQLHSSHIDQVQRWNGYLIISTSELIYNTNQKHNKQQLFSGMPKLLCPHCNTQMDYIALAYKCSKCFFVK